MGSATAERFGLGGAPIDGELTLGRLALLIGTQGCALGFHSGGLSGLRGLWRDLNGDGTVTQADHDIALAPYGEWWDWYDAVA
jgi:hypothetical protein